MGLIQDQLVDVVMELIVNTKEIFGHSMNEFLQEGISLDDLLIIPVFSEIKTRKTIDISNSLNNWNFKMPIISSPMTSISRT